MIRFLAMSVQHNGTHFLGVTLRYLTGLSSEGWPPPSVGTEPIGFSMRHLYGHHPAGLLSWPDKPQEEWWEKWINGTALPVVCSVRDHLASFTTLANRPQSNYGLADHVASLHRLEELLTSPRFHGFRIDGPRTDREAELLGVLEHVGIEPDMKKVRVWAEQWPITNSHVKHHLD